MRMTAYDEPEPDVTIVRGSDADYRHRIPEATDVVLLVEGSATSVSALRRRRIVYGGLAYQSTGSSIWSTARSRSTPIPARWICDPHRLSIRSLRNRGDRWPANVGRSPSTTFCHESGFLPDDADRSLQCGLSSAPGGNRSNTAAMKKAGGNFRPTGLLFSKNPAIVPAVLPRIRQDGRIEISACRRRVHDRRDRTGDRLPEAVLRGHREGIRSAH